MTIEIVDVGDGACSIVECGWSGCDSVTIVDCGEWRSEGREAADQLARHLGGRIQHVDRLVISHFDADHWKGLSEFANHYRSVHGHSRPTVEILYPGLPQVAQRLPEGAMALMSTAQGSTGVRAVDLVKKWSAVADVDNRPLFRGDNPIRMGCDSWEILWPPREVSLETKRWISSTLKELDTLADDLSDEGFQALRHNLDDAYSSDRPFFDVSDHHGNDNDDEERADAEGKDNDRTPSVSFDDPDEWEYYDEPSERSNPHAISEQLLEVFPESHIDRVRRLSRRLAKLNNYFSLVIHNPTACYQPHTLMLGDIEGEALSFLTRSAAIANRYDLVLAPHHGTHPAPTDFPSARLCVSQAGNEHVKQWHHHCGTHRMSACHSTAIDGSFKVW